MGLSIGEPEESGLTKVELDLATWPRGVTEFQIAQGNFVFLFFPLGSEAVKEEVIRVGVRRLGLPWASAGFRLLASCRSQGTGLQRLREKASQDTQGEGAMSAGPVASFPSPVWSYEGGQTHRMLCFNFYLFLPIVHQDHQARASVPTWMSPSH